MKNTIKKSNRFNKTIERWQKPQKAHRWLDDDTHVNPLGYKYVYQLD